MLAMFMQTLDSTIANVALPYMQGSMSASYDEITWVLTSYVIAAAIMTAPVGWLAVRFGRKRLFIICIIGFTAASMLCGAAQSLEQLVGFRLLQGMFGAALAPLSQATMLDIYPFSQRAQAMAIFSMGVTMGPMVGPTWRSLRATTTGPASARRLEHEHRDLARGPLLVLGVGRVRGHRALPPLGALVAGELPGGHRLLARAVLDLDVRVRAEVVDTSTDGSGRRPATRPRRSGRRAPPASEASCAPCRCGPRGW